MMPSRSSGPECPPHLDESGHVPGPATGCSRPDTSVTPALAAPAALAIFTFFAAWNNFMWQLVMAKDQTMMTLPVGISVLATGAIGSDRGVPDYGILMAGGTLGTIPMILFFVVFQRYFVKGIAAGALKG